MKKTSKLLVISAFVSTFANAAIIDENATKVIATGYKTTTQIAVPMTFTNVKFNFLKTQGSISEILTGATSSVDLLSVDTYKNPLRDKNMRDKLFSKFLSTSVQAKIKSVDGDDSKGTIKASITLNEQSKDVLMNYEIQGDKIKGDKLVATGVIDLETDFGVKEAYDSFRNDKIVSGLHAKQTSPKVQISFEVPIK